MRRRHRRGHARSTAPRAAGRARRAASRAAAGARSRAMPARRLPNSAVLGVDEVPHQPVRGRRRSGSRRRQPPPPGASRRSQPPRWRADGPEPGAPRSPRRCRRPRARRVEPRRPRSNSSASAGSRSCSSTAARTARSGVVLVEQRHAEDGHQRVARIVLHASRRGARARRARPRGSAHWRGGAPRRRAPRPPGSSITQANSTVTVLRVSCSGAAIAPAPASSAQLEDLLGRDRPRSSWLPEVDQLGARRAGGRARSRWWPATAASRPRRERPQPGRPVQRGAEVVAAALVRLARVDRDAHAQLEPARPSTRRKRSRSSAAHATASEARGNTVTRRVALALRLEQPAAVDSARTRDQLVVQLERRGHRLRIRLPQRREPSMSVSRKVTTPVGSSDCRPIRFRAVPAASRPRARPAACGQRRARHPARASRAPARAAARPARSRAPRRACAGRSGRPGARPPGGRHRYSASISCARRRSR